MSEQTCLVAGMQQLADAMKHLKSSIIKIRGNKNPIPMTQFLEYLTVKTKIRHPNSGRCNGWTERYNEEAKLVIGGGINAGVEYLDTIQHGNKQQNPHNNYVSPFYIYHLMNLDGKAFFVRYYRGEVRKRIKAAKKNVVELRAATVEAHSELLKNERILNLEAAVEGLKASLKDKLELLESRER